ncbi:MAG: hypothetical protein IKA31_04815 [Clostridia bacterium]|nr:hypothetical protein [Clostridia bacterium]
MTTNYIVIYTLIAVAVIFCSLFIIWQEKEKPWLSLCLKGFASLSFCALGLTGMFLATSLFLPMLFIVLGLVTSILGDLFLAGINYDNLNKDHTIISGMIAFSVAQIFYFLGLVFWTGFTIWPIIIAAVFAVGSILLEKPLKLEFGKTKYFALVYAFFLALTVAQSIFTAISIGFSHVGILLVIGFVLFLLSDLVLEMIYFKKDGNKTLLTYINLALYYVAQILIATSIFFI